MNTTKSWEPPPPLPLPTLWRNVRGFGCPAFLHRSPGEAGGVSYGSIRALPGQAAGSATRPIGREENPLFFGGFPVLIAVDSTQPTEVSPAAPAWHPQSGKVLLLSRRRPTDRGGSCTLPYTLGLFSFAGDCSRLKPTYTYDRRPGSLQAQILVLAGAALPNISPVFFRRPGQPHLFFPSLAKLAAGQHCPPHRRQENPSFAGFYLWAVWRRLNLINHMSRRPGFARRKRRSLGRRRQAPATPENPNPKPLPLEEQVRQRAHEIYLQRGGQDGSELDDWLQAEAEILASKDVSK